MRNPGSKNLIHLAALTACAVLPLPALAQSVETPATTPDAAPEVNPRPSVLEAVIISGSRISARGFTQPTPTTRLTASDLEKAAHPNIFQSLAELPALQGSTGRTTFTNSTSSGLQGLSSLSLRGLAPIRTLTLLDGQRVVPANVTGVADISQFPQLLVTQVDVVNGGAGASYGSDAVGGVVNFITDKRFKGFKANIEAGQTNYGDDKNGALQAAWGSSFLDDRAHIAVSVEVVREKGVPSPRFGGQGANGRTWFNNPAWQQRPTSQTTDGKPQLFDIRNAQQFQYSKYGLITQGPLQGTAFGKDGVPYKFEYGSNGVPTGTGAVTGCITPFCVGGDLSGTIGGGTTMGMNLLREVFYTRGSYDVNDDTEVYFTVNLARTNARNTPNPGSPKLDNLTIQCENPYLPASIKQACVDKGITSFKFGTAYGNQPKDIEVNPIREQKRFVVGANGKANVLGQTWSYDGYVEHGENSIDLKVSNIMLNPRFNAAIDAVRNSSGQIVCRNAIAVAAGCVPLNIIGDVQQDPAALAYVFPAVGPHQLSVQRQSVVSFNVNGQPFSNWAGPVAVAFGAEGRKESYWVTGDPYGNGVYPATPNTAEYPADPLLNTTVGNNWFAGNYHAAVGAYNVKEGFVEVNAPMFKSDSLGEANLNAAVRRTNYSTAGGINSWKIGSTWKTGIDGLRVRYVASRDVRAPNLSELFAAPVVVNQAVNFQGNTYNVQQRTIGNVNLRPELANNRILGLVLSQPKWAPGFSASIDYFDIKLKDVIATLGAQQEVDLCAAGNQEICAAMDLVSPVKYVTLQAFNLSKMRNKGFDMEALYRFNLASVNLPGKVTLRALATHTKSFLQESGIVGTIPAERAGVNLGDTPKWKAQFSQSWEGEKVSFTVGQRWVSDGVYSNEFIECRTNCPVSTAQHQTIDNNQMKGAFYWDLAGNYKINKNITAYFKIDNVTDVAPPNAPGTNTGYGVNPSLFDVLGRQYRVGARMSF
jgi:iron complex outermembrane receptor protein